MAWPCISRVCCLSRFWNQFDKSDLSVPLTLQNYSDLGEQEVRSVAGQVLESERTAHRSARSTDSPRGSTGARRVPGHTTGEDYHHTTQYKQDFKPWPIPKKENFPWITNGGARAESAWDSPCIRSERGGRHKPEQEDSNISSYRQEYRPWTGVKPSKSAKRSPHTLYFSPGSEVNALPPETSYQAAYSGEVSRSAGGHPGQTVSSPHASNTQSSAASQHLHRSPSPPSVQQSIRPERTEANGAAKTEEHLLRTKLPPNPSAVFQSGSKVFNI